MIKSTLGHLQININPENISYYKDLFTFLGWSLLYEDDNMLGIGDEHGSSLWFTPPLKDAAYDYDAPGMNHLAISVPNQEDVDEVVSYIKENGVEALFDTPRHRKEFSPDAEHTYYQVIFVSPDRIQFEVVYTGPKKA